MSCHITWCTAVHDKPANQHAHMAVVATFTRLMVIAFLVEQPGTEPDEVWVRMVYPVGERTREHDITPTAAADWSEMLATIDVRELAAISQALYRAGVTLGASA